MVQSTDLSAYHWYQIGVPDAVRVIALLGLGRVIVFDTAISNAFARLSKSVSLALSLAEAAYPLNDKKAIVLSIASIVITTMSSTRVKANFLCIKKWTKYYFIHSI